MNVGFLALILFRESVFAPDSALYYNKVMKTPMESAKDKPPSTSLAENSHYTTADILELQSQVLTHF